MKELILSALYSLCSEPERWCDQFAEFLCLPERIVGQEAVNDPCLGLPPAPDQKLPEVAFAPSFL